jgi:hypothetical protein
VQAWVNGRTLTDIEDPQERAAALKAVQPAVEQHTLYDYLIGHRDGHIGNFITNGHFTGIDKDITFENGHTHEKFRLNSQGPLAEIAGDANRASQLPIAADVGDMAQKGRAMVEHLKKTGNSRIAAQVQNRVEVLEKYVKAGGKTWGDLEKASDAPPRSLAKIWRNIFGA